MNQSVSGSERLSAANAEPRKPDSEIATWIAERKPAGFSSILSSRMAALSPSSSSILSLVVLSDTMAISRAANIALMAMKIA